MVQSLSNQTKERLGVKSAVTPSALDLFLQQRKAAENSLEQELSLDEINAEISAARAEISENANSY